MSLLSLALILLLIIDPLGNIPTYITLVKGISTKRRRWVILRETGIALAAMLLFYQIGEMLFSLLGFSECALRIASGLILFIIALKILFPTDDNLEAHLPAGEPFIFPLAIPLIAGPALLATIMLYAHLEQSRPLMLAAILIAWAATSLSFLCAPILYKYLGQNGLSACGRLTGMILVLVAIQRFADGVQLFITGTCP